jgi:aspartyl-tRNA(Asn)/glutamyl-tRNA(Gln) amidotransferase subunit B
VEEVKAKPKLAAWFVGQVMKQTGGKANPAAVNAALKTRLNLPDEG